MLKRYKIAAIPLRAKLFYLLISIFIAGVCLGVWAATDSDGEFLRALVKGYTDAQSAEKAADNFFLTISADAFLLLAVFLLGFSAVSIPVLAIIPFFKGLGVGAAASALYMSDPSFVPILKCFLGFTLTTAVSSYLLIAAVLSALKMSAGMFSHLSGRCEAFDLSHEGKKYCLKFLLFSVIIVINAVADTLLSVLLY